MEPEYETRLTQDEYQMFKMRTKQKETPDLPDYNGDASTQYYHGGEMGKLTDSEKEDVPGDDEWSPPKRKEMAPADEVDQWMDDFFADGSDQSEFFFTDPTDEDVLRDQGLKCQRDLGEGQNLNNSFGDYLQQDWEHLHVDKGMNPQFEILKPKQL